MRFRHVFSDGRELPLVVTPGMTGDTLALEEHADCIGCYPDIDLLPAQLIRDTVEVPFNFNVIIDIDRGPFPFGIFISLNRKWLQRRFIDCFKELPAGSIELLELPGIESFQKFPDGSIEFRKAEEGAMP